MSDKLKNNMPDICERYKINESDLISRAIATFLEKLKGQTEDQTKYLFVWCITRIYNGHYIPLDRSFLYLRSFASLSKKDEKEGAYAL